jgi:hypothetical protein
MAPAVRGFRRPLARMLGSGKRGNSKELGLFEMRQDICKKETFLINDIVNDIVMVANLSGVHFLFFSDILKGDAHEIFLFLNATKSTW